MWPSRAKTNQKLFRDEWNMAEKKSKNYGKLALVEIRKCICWSKHRDKWINSIIYVFKKGSPIHTHISHPLSNSFDIFTFYRRTTKKTFLNPHLRVKGIVFSLVSIGINVSHESKWGVGAEWCNTIFDITKPSLSWLVVSTQLVCDVHKKLIENRCFNLLFVQ